MKSIAAAGISVAAVVLLALSPCVPAATIHVANNGVDSAACGPSGNACRSITKAIHHAVKGDVIVVGPGKYGDLNGNGVLGEPGEEAPPANCSCVLVVNKVVTIQSSDGAASTVIDARTVDVLDNVEITANGAIFGKAGLGFTVTETKAATTSNCFGIDLATAKDVRVQGNLVVDSHRCPGQGEGITAGAFTPGGGLIQDNQVVGWDIGIGAGPDIVEHNVVQLNGTGIYGAGAAITGNVVTGNQTGIEVTNSAASATGNAVLGNEVGIWVVSLDGTIANVESNNVFGNSSCGVQFSADNVVATHNYWGRASGPLPPIDTCGSGAGTAIVTPFATKPFTITAPVNP